MKILLNSIAFTCIGLATLGMFLPVLPTTGPYIQNYLIHHAIPLRAKIISITTLWATILLSAYIVNPIWLKILLIFIAICVTIHILLFKTLQK